MLQQVEQVDAVHVEQFHLWQGSEPTIQDFGFVRYRESVHCHSQAHRRSSLLLSSSEQQSQVPQD